MHRAQAEPLRVAILGGGSIGAVHARSARVAGARVVGVAASSAESGVRAVERLQAERAFDSAEELALADEVDVVHICTPNNLHAPLAEAALGAGKHVICEKPLATTVADAARLTEIAARQPGQLSTVPFVYRFYAVVREARARVAAGESGALRMVHGTYLQDWMARPDDDDWRADPALGGPSRAFADIGSHWCDLVEFISGDRISAVCAELAAAFPERGGEDLAAVVFRMQGGALGTLVVSQVAHGRKNALTIELAGSEATLAFDQERPESLWVGRRDGSEQVLRDPETLSPAAARYATLPAGHPQGYHDCFDSFVADSYAVARGAEAPDGLPGFADGARAGRVVDAVLESARSRTWVDVAAVAS